MNTYNDSLQSGHALVDEASVELARPREAQQFVQRPPCLSSPGSGLPPMPARSKSNRSTTGTSRSLFTPSMRGRNRKISNPPRTDELLRHLRCHLQHAIQHRLQIGDRLPRAWRYLAADEPIPSRTWLRPQRNVIAKLKLLHLPFTGARTWSAKVRCCLGSGGFVVVDNLLDHPL